MMNINRVVLTGNLTRDPELRTTGGGTSVCSLRLAVNGRRKNPSTSEWEDVPNYFDVTVWGAQGENCARYLSKGRGVAVDGRLQWREWVDSNENKRQAVDVVAENVQFLSDGSGGNGGGNGGRSRAQDTGSVEAADFEAAPVATAAAPVEDDVIPFLHDGDSFEFDAWHCHANR